MTGPEQIDDAAQRNGRPRGELFSSRAAAAVWAAIETLEVGDQHEVLDLLHRRLVDFEGSRNGDEKRKARAVSALRCVAELLGHSPSVEEYRRLRNENFEEHWPADGSIRRWLGGNWAEASLPAPEVIAEEIVEHLSAALDQFQAVAAELRGNGDSDAAESGVEPLLGSDESD